MGRSPRHRPRKPQGGQLRGLAGGTWPDKQEAGADTPAGRQLGLDSRDIPGGLPHLVNPESAPTRPASEEPRPLFDGMNAHGVIDPDPAHGYTDTPTDVKPGPRAAPVPHWDDAVPVRIVEGKGSQVHRATGFDSIRVAASTAAEPTRLANADTKRVELLVLNEDTVNDVRIGTRTDLAQSKGALLSHFTNSYRSIPTEDELFAQSTSANTVLVSVIYVTEVAGSES